MNALETINTIAMTAIDWVHLFMHFCVLSFLAIGGAISTAPDMHRYLVVENHLLSDAQFSTSITLAQVAPGPNVLFVSLMGWNIGLNSAGGIQAGWTAWTWGLFGAVLCVFAMVLPSSVMMYKVAQWGHKNSQRPVVRAFKSGLAPIVIGLMMSTGWLLQKGQHLDSSSGALIASWGLTILSALLVWKTRIHLLWLLALGALLGALGIV
jgi:chromate transporter